MASVQSLDLNPTLQNAPYQTHKLLSNGTVVAFYQNCSSYVVNRDKLCKIIPTGHEIVGFETYQDLLIVTSHSNNTLQIFDLDSGQTEYLDLATLGAESTLDSSVILIGPANRVVVAWPKSVIVAERTVSNPSFSNAQMYALDSKTSALNDLKAECCCVLSNGSLLLGNSTLFQVWTVPATQKSKKISAYVWISN